MPHVFRSTVLDHPVETVWSVLRDFNSHTRWHPAIAESEIEHFYAPDSVGCVRRFTLHDGARLREQLLALSDRDRVLRYGVVSSTVPLRDYVAELRLRPVGDGARTFAAWDGRFAAPPGRAADLADLVARDVYEAGFAGLREHLRSAAAVGGALPHGVPPP